MAPCIAQRCRYMTWNWWASFASGSQAEASSIARTHTVCSMPSSRVRPRISGHWPQMSYGNFSETFLATSSENSQTWHTSRFCGDRHCLQIAAASFKSGGGGGNKASKLGTFDTFLHVELLLQFSWVAVWTGLELDV